jgi:4-amino-4-deoxy-L-arabinose transferase-like glycosyltransferase
MKKNKIVLLASSPIVILLIAGFILRVILFFIFQPYYHLDEVIASDAEGYHKLALQLLQHGNFIVQGTDLDTFRTPGYPVFIFLIYGVFGINVSAVLFIQILINLASVFILYYIGKMLIDKTYGFICALLFCIEPDHLQYIFSLLTDTLFVFLLLLSCLFLILFFKKVKSFYLIIASIVLGLATLVRPISFLFPIVIVSGLIIYLIKYKKGDFLNIVRYLAIVLISFGITISPWLIRNYYNYGYAELSSISGYNLLNYNVAFAAKRIENKPIENIRDDFDNIVLKKGCAEKMYNPFYKSKIQGEVAKDFIMANKWEYFKAHCLGMINIYSSMDFKTFSQHILRIGTKKQDKYNGGSFDKFSIDLGRFKILPFSIILMGGCYAILFFFYYITAVCGAVLFAKERKYLLLFFMFTPILYFTILIGVVGLARYKLPISPFYIILSAYCVYSSIKQWKKKEELI